MIELKRILIPTDIHLIVMGTHGRGPIAHMLMGSVAEKVVRNAHARCSPCDIRSMNS